MIKSSEKNLKIYKEFSLKEFNTFGIEIFADFFVEIKNLEDLNLALDFAEEKNINLDKILFLGSGSNILLTQDFKGLVIKNGMKGILNVSSQNLINLKKIPLTPFDKGGEIQRFSEEIVFVKCNGGEVWDDFVAWTLDQNLFGLENLSLIPGQVGTCPIQNIGAYGVEVKDFIYEVEVLDLKTREIKILKNSECEFGYRDSYFKRNKQKYFIISVTFQLSRKFLPNLKYGIIKSELEKKNILEKNITGQDVRNTVIEIRESKLPDPKKLGNSGSFFKNPVVEENILKKIQKNFEDVPNYKVREKYKIPAGWLIEQAGFKGKKFENCGIHEKQALVLVNYGGATGQEIFELAQTIQSEVEEKFGILLEMEVNVI